MPMNNIPEHVVAIIQYNGIDGQGRCSLEIPGYRVLRTNPLIGNRDAFLLEAIPPPPPPSALDALLALVVCVGSDGLECWCGYHEPGNPHSDTCVSARAAVKYLRNEIVMKGVR